MSLNLKIPPEEIKNVLRYDPASGLFYWKTKISKRMKPVAGCLNNTNGYIQITFKSKYYSAHRLAWFFCYGEIPKLIDHVNGIKTDNRIENLRSSTHRKNLQNKNLHRNGRLPGCYYNKTVKKWIAKIWTGKKRVHLGVFNSEKEAHLTYKLAEKILMAGVKC